MPRQMHNQYTKPGDSRQTILERGRAINRQDGIAVAITQISVTKQDKDPAKRQILIFLPPELVAKATALNICIEIHRENAVFYTEDGKHSIIAGLQMPGFDMGNEQLPTPYEACLELIKAHG